jgi:low temperature requirement protein LtrA
LMFSGLVMAVVLPEAFDGRGLAFVVAYLTTQVGRSLFCIWALRGHELQRNFVRVAAWFVVSAVPWFVGAMVEGDGRTALWALAMALETLAGFVGFYVPGLSYTRSREWTISAEHFIERCQLFVIIALGESIIITGGTFSDGELTAKRTTAFVVAFLGSVAFWWIFFLKSARITPERSREHDAGGFARVISYTMVVVVVGIIIGAVGDELVIAHPTGHMETAWLVVIFGAPAVFVAGMMLVEAVTLGTFTPWGLVALAALGVLALTMREADPLAAAIAAFAVLIGVAAYDTVTSWGELQRRLLPPGEVVEGAGSTAD